MSIKCVSTQAQLTGQDFIIKLSAVCNATRLTSSVTPVSGAQFASDLPSLSSWRVGALLRVLKTTRSMTFVVVVFLPHGSLSLTFPRGSSARASASSQATTSARRPQLCPSNLVSANEPRMTNAFRFSCFVEQSVIIGAGEWGT